MMEVRSGAVRHAFGGLAGRQIDELGVAHQAAPEWPHERPEVEMIDDLRQLPPRVDPSEPITALDDLSLEQSTIPGQQDAVLSSGSPCQFIVLEPQVMDGVEAKHPQVPCQPAQVVIGQETWLGQSRRLKPVQVREIEGLEGREDGDAVAGSHRLVEPDPLVVGQDQVDFRVRHADSLDEILHGGRQRQGVLKRSLPSSSRQEIIQ